MQNNAIKPFVIYTLEIMFHEYAVILYLITGYI